MTDEQRLHAELLGLLPEEVRPTCKMDMTAAGRDRWFDWLKEGYTASLNDDLAHLAIRGAAYGWLAGCSFVEVTNNRDMPLPWCASDEPHDGHVFPTEVEALIHAVRLALA